jgi:hypothetical protein
VSRSLGPNLPLAVRALLDGADLATKIGETFLLLTTDAAGWPSVAMLSVGEVLAHEPGRLRFALWPSSSTTASLTRAGRGTLALIVGNAGYYVRCSGARGADLVLVDGSRLAYFDLAVEDVLEDVVTYAELTSGIRFRLPDPAAVLPRWQATVAALRAA